MIVIMMTILALLPHMSSAMEQNSFDEHRYIEGAEEGSNVFSESLDEGVSLLDDEGTEINHPLGDEGTEINHPLGDEGTEINHRLEDEGTEINHLLEYEAVENLEETLLRSLEEASDEEGDRLIVYNATELRRVFTHGNATGGDSNWSGERVVYLAFENLGSSVSTALPPSGTERVVILRSLDGQERNLTSNTGSLAIHFQIGNRNKVILEDENLHIVGHNFNEKVAGTVGGGLRIDNGGTFELRQGTIRHITSSFFDSPIIVRSGGTFIMEGGEIRNNRGNTGGAITVNGGLFELFDGAIYENYAVQYGGSMEVTVGGTLNMYGGIIKNNYAEWYGGGLELNTLSTFNMYEGEISGNIAAGDGGGGLRVNGSSLFNMFDGLIDGNKVTSDGRFPYGGGVGVYNDSTFNMNGGTISNNTSHRGGGVAAWEGIFNLGTGRSTSGRAPADQKGAVGNPVIIGNTATGGGLEHTTMIIGYGGGGGVLVYGKGGFNGNVNFTMHSGLITENTTSYRGGGVFVNSAEFHMRGGEISNNRTTENNSEHTGGGGVYLHENNWIFLPANFLMTGGAIRNNSSRDGGGIARNNNALPIRINGDSIISGNIAQRLGGGIFTHTPAPENNPINNGNIGQNRGNFTTASTVRFERNRSLMAVSRGLTVGQVRTNNATIYSNLQWMGRNSTNGLYNDDSSFHLFNNHDVSNLQGIPILEESFDFYQVIEKYVDIYGNPIEERGDTIMTLGNGEIYSPTPPEIDGYIMMGYKWGLSPDEKGEDYHLGFPGEVLINEGKVIYFVYKEKGTDVMITKMVTGELANRINPFDFTVYFMDKDKKPLNKGQEIQYIGGILYESGGVAHDNGVLVLDEDGKGTLALAHGQIVKLMDLPKDIFIRIVEEEDVNYIVTYKDSLEVNAGAGNDTRDKAVGREERVFEFINNRYEVLPLGIKDEGKELEVVSLFCIVTACTGMAVGMTTKKRKILYDNINYW